jgi:hypothetical protein
MSEKIFFFDDTGKKVSVKNATKFVKVVTDESGNVIQESSGSIK